ncbi:hypothetical protein Tco_1092835 [Tanacetum coccineum]|uniref:Uncharacterized protein n=1 Tax=Tanacetum coccineum TaxID=301880 RepID=A0ABQ5ICZ6_9ASTR
MCIRVGCEPNKKPTTQNYPRQGSAHDQIPQKLTLASIKFEWTFNGEYRAAAPGFYQRNNANPSYQERRQSMEETLSKFMIESANGERGFRSLPRSTEANLIDHVKSISTNVEADSNLTCSIGSPQYAVSTPQNRRLMFESRQTTIPFPSRLNDYYLDGDGVAGIKRCRRDLYCDSVRMSCSARRPELKRILNHLLARRQEF